MCTIKQYKECKNVVIDPLMDLIYSTFSDSITSLIQCVKARGEAFSHLSLLSIISLLANQVEQATKLAQVSSHLSFESHRGFIYLRSQFIFGYLLMSVVVL